MRRKSPSAAGQRAGRNAFPGGTAISMDLTTNDVTMQAFPFLSPEAQVRLALLAARTGLSPDTVIEILALSATPQLVNTCARLTPRFVANGWRPRCLPVNFFVRSEGGQDVY